MRKTRTYKEFNTTGTFKREEVWIKFSRSGVDQEWTLRFNNGRLITDEVHTNWDKSTHLRRDIGCKNLQDVLEFLYKYSYSKNLIKIIRVRDYTDTRTKAILDFDIDFKALKGSVYFGRHEISFNEGYATFTGNYGRKINDGTYKIRGKRDLLLYTNQIVGRLADNMEFIKAIKKLEQINVQA